MISRAVEAGVPFAWFTADEAYGQAKWLQAWLEERGVSYVMAIRRSDTLTMAEGERRPDDLVAAAPARSWQKISAGAGAHGPREYHWTRIPVRPGWERGRGYWPLARRSLTSPEEISYYACYGPCVTDPHKWLIHGERLLDDTPHIRVSLADVELEDSRAAAARGVEEETGWHPRRVEFVMSCQPLVGNADDPQDLYLPRGADLVGEPDADEAAEVRWVPLEETPEMIDRGDILGAITIIGVQYALLQRPT